MTPVYLTPNPVVNHFKADIVDNIFFKKRILKDGGEVKMNDGPS
jgi:hypothetical protein